MTIEELVELVEFFSGKKIQGFNQATQSIINENMKVIIPLEKNLHRGIWNISDSTAASISRVSRHRR